MDDYPDFFTDGARIVFGPPGITLALTRTRMAPTDGETAADPEVMAVLRMNHVMAAQMVRLLAQAIKALQEQPAAAVSNKLILELVDNEEADGS